ncbi:response regulator [Gordonia neofelifaecis]|uniref:LuxR family transcriptional regulator n=1 Tax=Gordonia neofelifaecis NRRL B-59395 TaxID=644548 RepID=F1YNS4_9ACTN|nr:response regulator transcription factor [Gordonia neofelifaecis]EGD53681.1 LuxR family transcriptional regulator [Gordonia neofelifaecis NRRL B-59395]
MTEAAEPTRVLVVDDEQLVRAGFRLLIDSTPDLTTVGEAGEGGEAVRAARRLRPDVVVMDIRMPGIDGLEATRLIADDEAAPRILIVTTFDHDEYVFAALRGGASGFLLKDTPPEELLEAVRTVARGDALLAPAVTRRLITEFARAPTAPTSRPAVLDVLTERELEVFELVAVGLSNGEIADRLHLGLTTVKTHIGRLLTKLDARDRVHLVIRAYETGLVSAGGSAEAG